MFAPKRAELPDSDGIIEPREKMLQGLKDLDVAVPEYTEPIKKIDGRTVETLNTRPLAEKAREEEKAAKQLREKI